MYRYYVSSYTRFYTNDDRYMETINCHVVTLTYKCNTLKNINKLADMLKEKVVEDNENVKSVSVLYVISVIELTPDEEDEEK